VIPTLLAQGSVPSRWDWEFAAQVMPALLSGLWVTIQATLVGITLAMALGLVLAIARRSRRRFVSWPIGFAIEFIRSTPLLVQLYVLFFVLPDFGIRLSGFTAGVIGLGLHYGAYTSESYRAGIESVPRGQWEAALASNLKPLTTWTTVILPQAIPTVLPALGNYLIAMFKDAPMLAFITVFELLGTANEIQKNFFRGIEVFTLAGLLFLAVSIPSSFFVRYLERRYAFQRE